MYSKENKLISKLNNLLDSRTLPIVRWGNKKISKIAN